MRLADNLLIVSVPIREAMMDSFLHTPDVATEIDLTRFYHATKLFLVL
jgi:hypothetical protein